MAAGTYAEGLEATGGSFSLVGAEGVILAPPQGTAGIILHQPVDVTLRGLTVEGASTVGVWVLGGTVTLEDSTVRGTTEGTDEQGAAAYGYGVVASGGALVTLEACEVRDNAGVGVLFAEARGIILKNLVAGNAGGGVQLQFGADPITVDDNEISANSGFGLSVLSAAATVTANTITDTGSTEPLASGDGVVVAGLPAATPPQVEMTDNVVEGHARVGVLFSTGAYGIILKNRVATNGFGGVWLQGAGGAEGVTIEDNEIVDNTLIGVRVGPGAYGIISKNLIARTGQGQVLEGLDTVEMADGVAIVAGGAASVEVNLVEDNERVGIILHAPAPEPATQVGDNEVTGNGHGIIVQALADAAPEVSGNTLADNMAGDDVEQGGADALVDVSVADHPVSMALLGAPEAP